ncbi:VirC2 family conjugal transfer protein [Jiella pacifica]|uniref:Uncharacterized protein n=1 Tax=Jiella pacifica TaxID=2696469 RepID=A0A6N9T5R9_9HYPH|nr:VirC2 family conjugal transfer protein [Jiella pacifica]NDW06724.1 hypothetical protein [Jiella pacifica]
MGFKRPSPDMPDYAEVRSRISPLGKFANNPVETESAPPKKPQRAQTPADNSPPAAPIAPPAAAKPAPAKKPGQQEPASKASGSQVSPGNTIQLKGTAAYPATGHDAHYDQAVAAYGERRALQLLLPPAVKAYVAAVQSGTIGTTLADYPRAKGGLKVARTLEVSMVEQIKAILDPMGLMSPGSLASEIFRQALSYKMGARGK